MNPASTPNSESTNELPSHLPDTSAQPTDEQIAEIEDELHRTPKTLPLKRGNSPLFVPTILPELTGQPLTGQPLTGQNDKSEEPTAIVGAGTENSDATESQSADALSQSVVTVEPESALPSVTFAPPPEAIHRASVTLELNCASPEASIRYAIDTEDVGEDGTLYNPAEKIFLTQSATVAARAFVNGQGGPLALGRFEIVKPSWQKLEPTEQIDPTTHEASEEAILEGHWRLAAASVRGRLHAHRGGWREDAFRHAVAHAADGTYSIVVVSDGAGSATSSRVGSNLLCQTACDSLSSALTNNAPLSGDSKTLIERDLPVIREQLVNAATEALQKLREEAATRNQPLSDFAATLLILVRREWNGQQLCAALQAGDGSIALWNGDDTLTLLGAADHGTHSSETRFLTTSGIEAELASRVKFSIRPNLRALAVMSDGVSDDYFPEATRFPELFKEILPIVEDTQGNAEGQSSGAALLKWIDYEKKGSSDDRTLVVCWRNGNSSNSSEEARDGEL